MSDDELPGARVLPVGDRALLVECSGSTEALALWRRLRAERPTGVVEPVVAARTVLVRVAEGSADRVRHLLEGMAAALEQGGPDGPGRPGAVPGEDREAVVETVYDGEDLATVAALLGTSVDGLVARHGATSWTSAFLGFAPGFAYLQADQGWPEVPRHAAPRTRVPAGSVALAGTWSAVYPAASPGGWQLLGRTEAPVWDVERAEPALLTPGTRVRFRPVRGRVVAARADPDDTAVGSAPAPVPARADRARAGLDVLGTGPLCLVQDLGRRGHLSLGVPTSGALDRRAASRANRLVGNDRDRAVLELLLGGLVVQAVEDVVVAVTGAPAPTRLALPGRDVEPAPGRPFLVPAGAVLTLGTPSRGLRTYVAVRGGLDVPAVLGSRATDLLSGLGPPPVRAGDRLLLLPPPGTAVPTSPDDDAHDVPTGPEHAVGVVSGPRAEWLTPAARELLGAHPWVVTERSNRVGLRLAGPALERSVSAELPSEGTVPGAVQVPPDGRPVVFLADHPVTGGYPVVAVVRDADLDRLGQLRPGDRLRLLPVGDP